MRKVQYTDDFPGAHVGQHVILLNEQGVFTVGGAAVHEITAVEPMPAMPHGAIPVWGSGDAPAGYLPDAQGLFNQVTKAGVNGPVPPQSLVVGEYQLLQARFRPKFMGIPNGFSVDDFDVFPSLGALPRWKTQFVQGVMHHSQQVPDPADAIELPLQGGTMQTPQAYPGQDFWKAAKLTEQWSYGVISPSFSLVNNGVAAIPAGGTFTWFMEVMGAIYNILPIVGADTRKIHFLGEQVDVPRFLDRDDIAPIQIGMRSPIRPRP